MFSNENLFNIPHLKLHVKKINRKKKIQYMYSTQNKENLIFFLSLILQFLAFFECIYLGCKIYSSLHSNQSDIVCMWNIGTGKLIIWANKNKYEKHFYRITIIRTAQPPAYETCLFFFDNCSLDILINLSVHRVLFHL